MFPSTFFQYAHLSLSYRVLLPQFLSTSSKSISIPSRLTQGPRQSVRPYHSHGESSQKPFRMAVIGSGPAGFYSAYRVMTKLDNAVIDMYEKLPVPFGLVRYGVAPDHPEVKNCQEKFTEVASSPKFNFIGNVDIGHDVDLSSLLENYHAILFAYGASKDRRLGVSGEDLPGVYSARAFVGWYNGLPEYADLKPDLSVGEEAVVIGQGNVALDVARILLSDPNRLKSTDITGEALSVLSKSKVKHVHVVGRRGPMQAAFTIREVRELMNLAGVGFEPIKQGLLPSEPAKLPRAQKRLAQLLAKGSSNSMSEATKSWSLRFLRSPIAFGPSTTRDDKLGGVRFKKNSFEGGVDSIDPKAKIFMTNEEEAMSASMAFRSIGYKSEPLLGMKDTGLPFDDRQGIIPNDGLGRVSPGIYCTGWVKNGPTGVIATTMDDAFSTADAIVSDWESENLFLGSEDTNNTSKEGWHVLKNSVEAQGIRSVSWNDWLKIDAEEKRRGKDMGKEREKFTSVKDILEILK